MDDSQQRTSVNEVTGSVHPDPKATINGDPPLLNTADRGFISSTKMDKIAECTDPNSAPESTVSFEVGQVSITKSNGIHTEENGTVETNSKLLPEAREVSIKEAEEAGGNEDLEKVLPDGPDHQAEIENDIEVANGEMETQMGVGQKKRKKRKPKSKRGLVNDSAVINEYQADVLLSSRMLRLVSKTIMWILPSHLRSMKKRRACMIGKYIPLLQGVC